MVAGRGERETCDHRMRAAADVKGFPECEGIFCVGVLPVCISHDRVCSPRHLSRGCSRLNRSSLPKAAPTHEHPILTNDRSVFALSLSPSLPPHPLLILLSHSPMSNPSPISVNTLSLISLASNALGSVPTAADVAGGQPLPPRLGAP